MNKDKAQHTEKIDKKDSNYFIEEYLKNLEISEAINDLDCKLCELEKALQLKK